MLAGIAPEPSEIEAPPLTAAARLQGSGIQREKGVDKGGHRKERNDLLRRLITQ